ncbi:MAG TPA: hypothetical protein VIJ23_01070 [Mycobacterium sp.]
MVAETRTIAGAMLIDGASPTALKQAALQELTSLAPILRRFPRRLERIADAAEHGRFAVGARLLAGERERAVITGLVHQLVVAFLAATTGIMAVLLFGADGGPVMAPGITLYQFIGYRLLVISFILGLRVIAPVFRRGAG